MNTNSNNYTLVYATVMVVVVALMLALVSGALKSKQDENIRLDKKKQILSSLKINFDGQDASKLYDQYITGGMIVDAEGKVVDKSKDKAFDVDIIKEMAKPADKRQLPVYVGTVDGETKYILSMRGTGLWGPIWGYLSLNEDKSTVNGAYFSHASETPGLGAEIAEKPFQNEFPGKKLMNDKNEFVSIAIVKPGQSITDRDYVDGISGGTITSKGVNDMLLNSIGQYKKFLEQK